jgi:hypothetical protein
MKEQNVMEESDVAILWETGTQKGKNALLESSSSIDLAGCFNLSFTIY